MKKILFLAVLFVVSTSAFSQTFEKDIKKLMYAKNGLGAVENITTKLSKGVAENDKAKFEKEMNDLVSRFIDNTVEELKTNYTNEQINAIYAEFHSDKINYEEETIQFFSNYRRLKGEFFRSAKELYYQYIQ